MLEAGLGACFLHVEAIAQRVLATSGGVVDETYATRAFEAILRAIEDAAREHHLLVIETTGASESTPAFLAALRERCDVRLVRLHARRETCEARMADRDQSQQVQVPAELVREMHARSVALELPWDLELDNDPGLTPRQVERAFGPLVVG
jgi:hypothetical protein